MDIPTLAIDVWTVVLPLLPLLASKGAEKLGEEAGGALWTAVKEKFEKKPETKKVVDKLLKDPESTKMQGAFQYQLEELLEKDENFVKELAALLKNAQKSYKAELKGNGAIAQGNGATAVGAGGVSIGGSVSGNTIVTGDGNLIEK